MTGVNVNYTNGVLMGTFLALMFGFLLMTSIFLNCVLIKDNLRVEKKIREMIDFSADMELFNSNITDLKATVSISEGHINEIWMTLSKMCERLENIRIQNDDTKKFLSEKLETKPMKPNNWDSLREAFKGPVRIVDNVRD